MHTDPVIFVNSPLTKAFPGTYLYMLDTQSDPNVSYLHLRWFQISTKVITFKELCYRARSNAWLSAFKII